jgi:DNA polymerase-3 subunit beta
MRHALADSAGEPTMALEDLEAPASPAVATLISTALDRAQLRYFAGLAKPLCKRNPLPWLECVQLDVGEHETTLRATDLETTVSFRIPSGFRSQPGAALIPFAAFGSIPAKGCELVSVGASETLAVIQADGTRSEYATRSTEDFPVRPSGESRQWVSLPAWQFRQMLGAVTSMMGTDVSRDNLRGMFIERRNGLLHFVATDGHRMARVSTASRGAPFSAFAPRGAVITAGRAASKLQKSTGVSIVGIGQCVGFSWANMEILGRVVNDAFPSHYENLILLNNPRVLTVDRDTLAARIKAVAQNVKSRDSGVEFRFDADASELVVSADILDVGKRVATMGATCDGGLPKGGIGFAAMYLLDALASMPEKTVRIELAGELDPALFVSADRDITVTVMPMRI